MKRFGFGVYFEVGIKNAPPPPPPSPPPGRMARFVENVEEGAARAIGGVVIAGGLAVGGTLFDKYLEHEAEVKQALERRNITVGEARIASVILSCTSSQEAFDAFSSSLEAVSKEFTKILREDVVVSILQVATEGEGFLKKQARLNVKEEGMPRSVPEVHGKYKPSKDEFWAGVARYCKKKPQDPLNEWGFNFEGGGNVREMGISIVRSDGRLLAVEKCFFVAGEASTPAPGAPSREHVDRWESCSHNIAKIMTLHGREVCLNSSVFTTASLRCSLCWKVLVQCGVARVIHVLPKTVEEVEEEFSFAPTRTPSSAFLEHHPSSILTQEANTLLIRTSTSFHNFCNSPILEARIEQILEFLEDNGNDVGLSSLDKWFFGLSFLVRLLTDDVETGCGAIVTRDKEFVGIGWNAYVSKCNPTLDFAIGRSGNYTKYPFMVHSEQNALIFSHHPFSSGNYVVYASRVPCKECGPLLVSALKPSLRILFGAADARDGSHGNGPSMIANFCRKSVELVRLILEHDDGEEASKYIPIQAEIEHQLTDDEKKFFKEVRTSFRVGSGWKVSSSSS